jgi:hypothetical protein
MDNQLNTKEILRKDFLNIFEISHLFDVSGITARRHINEILGEIDLLQDKMKLDIQGDGALITQKLNTLSGKARRRVIGRARNGKDIFILELSKKEAMAKWGMRPTVVEEMRNVTTQMTTQMINQEDNHQAETENNQEVIGDGYGQKYIELLESQLTEKDDTIKDLRETNKFLSITNGKLNEQLKLLLEKPRGTDRPQENI